VLAIADSGAVPMIGGVDALIVLIAVADHRQAYWAAAAAVLGSTIGSLFIYYLARKGGEAYVHRHTLSRRGAMLRAWFEEYGLLTVFVPAFVPIPMPMKVFVLSAGAMGVPPATFIIVLLAARIPRYLFLAWLGSRLGNDTLPYLKHHWWEWLLFAAVLFAVLYFAIRWLHARRTRATDLA